jgi:hypothetical protein
MTTSDPRQLGLAVARGLARDDDERVPDRGGEIVGADDARADAVRAGGDADLTDADRDSDGVPTGRADADADAARAAGADPEDR